MLEFLFIKKKWGRFSVSPNESRGRINAEAGNLYTGNYNNSADNR